MCRLGGRAGEGQVRGGVYCVCVLGGEGKGEDWHLLRHARGQPWQHERALPGGAEAHLELQDQPAHVGVERVHLPSRQAEHLGLHAKGVAPENEIGRGRAYEGQGEGGGMMFGG